MGKVALDGRLDITTGHTTLRHSDLGALVPRSLTVTWNQMAEPVVEPDTLYIFNAAQETQIAQGTPGGFIASGGFSNGTDVAWTAPAATQTAGAFRGGVQVNKRSSGSLWIPCDGMLDPSSFHIEGRWRPSVSGTFPDLQNLLTWGSTAQGMVLSINGGANPKATLTYQHSQDPTVTSRSYTLASPILTLTSGTDIAIAFSMTPAGVFTLYVNGSQVAQQTGCVPARLFSGQPPGSGLVLLGNGSTAAEDVSCSDLKASRTPRVPGVPITVTDANVLTFNPASLTGATINKKLPGVLKHLKGEPGANVANGSPGSPVVNVARCGGLLNAPPIKAGAPDAAHPTLGQSGLYSYDWSCVDRTIHHITQDMGFEVYLNLDACPNLLGGGPAPFTYIQVTTVGNQTPDVLGSLAVSSTTGTNVSSWVMEVGASGNVYQYGNRSPTQFTGLTLLSGTAGKVIPAGTTMLVGIPYCNQQVYGAEVPTDNVALGHMAGDAVDHVVNGLGVTIPYCTIWNEPGGSTFWKGTEAQFIAMYQAMASAVRAVAPTVKVGMGELAGWSSGTAFWVQDLINACATGGQPLDFV